MAVLIVVDHPKQWPLSVPNAEVVTASDYLTDRRFVESRRAKVFNLCRSYGYQTVGYYVSLLAEARGHKPLPTVTTIQDMKESSLLRICSDNLEQVLQKNLAPIKGDHFQLSIYFGRNLVRRYDSLCQSLFDHFPAPFLRAEFVRSDDEWRLRSCRPIAFDEIPDSHEDFVIEQAQRFFERPRRGGAKRPAYDLAILLDPTETDAPSDEAAIKRFMRAAEKLGMAAWTVDKYDFGRIAEFDALFIRATTAVNHHTYRFSRRAEAEGLVVIDDPESIVRCTNKVYLAEVFEKHSVPAPRTMIVHDDNIEEVAETLGLPLVLKRPDSSFSAGVVKASDMDEYYKQVRAFLDKSELVVAQEYMRSAFDWRVGVLDGKPLYACKYHMARGHWQIQKAVSDKGRRYGRVETMGVDEAPLGAIELGVQAANLIGRGLYGVDIKEVDGRFYVIEVNDNPSIDAGYEDTVLKDVLYEAVMGTFYERLERGRRQTGKP
jgi:glutathione synthase/RimK-type ligase-like ATP-grasp enzyme